MSIYVNRLPIEFGKEGVVLYDLGYEGVGALGLKTNSRIFEQGGIWCAIAPATIQAGRKTLRYEAHEIASQLIPYLLDRLAVMLRSLGGVDKMESSVHFVDVKGVEFDLMVELDHDLKQYFVVIHPVEAANASVALHDITELVHQLVDRFLPESQARIGHLKAERNSRHSLPNLIFDSYGTQICTAAGDGLRRYGPYDRKQFSHPELRILVIGRQAHEGYLSSLIRDLQDGIPMPKEVAQIWGKSWAESYRLKSIEFAPLVVEKYQDNRTRERIASEIEASRANGKAIDLVIYEADQTAANLEAFLFRMEMPFHLLVPSELQRQGVDRAMLLQDLALTLYAKLGGKPWLLPIGKLMEHHLVIGVGSESWTGGMVGYATIFTSHGNYQLGDARWVASEADRTLGLVDLITNQLKLLGRIDGWKNRDKLKITFHLDQKWNGAEIEMVKSSLLHAFGPIYDLQVIFLHLDYGHHYMMVDQLPEMATHGAAVSQVETGTTLKLSNEKYLVQMVDAGRNIRTYKPLKVELLKGSDACDLGFLVHQIYEFGSLSWRTVQRTPLPVTLEYGKLIAGKGKLLQGVDPLIGVREKFLTIPWYL